MKTTSLLLALSLLSVAFVPGSVSACSCAMTEDVAEELEDSAAVFVGTVTSVDQQRMSELFMSSDDPVYVDFEVESVFKGEVIDPQRVYTLSDDGACGYAFEEGKAYVVFASQPWTYDDSGIPFEVNLCSMTQELSDAEDVVDELESLVEPSDPAAATGQPPVIKNLAEMGAESTQPVLLGLMEQVIFMLQDLLEMLQK